MGNKKQMQKQLALAIFMMITYGAGAGSGTVYAQEDKPPAKSTKEIAVKFDKGITGAESDREYFTSDNIEIGYYESMKGVLYYKFNKDVTFMPVGTPGAKVEENKRFDVNAQGYTVSFVSDEEGIVLLPGSSFVAQIAYQSTNKQPPGLIRVQASEKKGMKAGIHLYGNPANGKQSWLAMYEPVTIQGKIRDAGSWAGKNGASYQGNRHQTAGVVLESGNGTMVSFEGGLNLDVEGNGIVLDPQTAPRDNLMNVAVAFKNNGIFSEASRKIRIYTPESKTRSFYAIANYGGTISINRQNGVYGNGDVNIYGNILTMKGGNELGEKSWYYDGETEIGLGSRTSSWTGVIDNAGKEHAGKVSLYLLGQSSWNHKAVSLTNGMRRDTMSEEEAKYYGIYDGVSYLSLLTVSNGNGNIRQQDLADIEVGTYVGSAATFYNAKELQKGKQLGVIRLQSIKGKTAQMDVIAYDTGIRNATEEMISSYLAAGAKEIEYPGNKTDKGRLSSLIALSDGDQIESALHFVRNITFDPETGKGTYRPLSKEKGHGIYLEDQKGSTWNIQRNLHIDTGGRAVEIFGSKENLANIGMSITNRSIAGKILIAKKFFDNDVFLVGNVYAQAGVVNIGLNNEKSVWQGVALSGENGVINIGMQDKGYWIHEKKGNEKDFKGSVITSFAGAMDKKNKAATGYVFQKETLPIKIKNYSGKTTFIYEHDGDGTKLEQYKGGDVVIEETQAGSEVIFVTDRNGIDVNEEETVGKVLDILAHKLTYVGYTKGNFNLFAKVGIAEGITTPVTFLTTRNVSFEKDTGKGTINSSSSLNTYNQSITGDIKKDKKYKEIGILGKEGVYTFSPKGTYTVSLADGNPITVERDITINADGSVLNLHTAGTRGISKSDGQYKTEIHAKKVHISVDNLARVEGIHLGGQGESTDQRNYLVIDGDTSIQVKGGPGYTLGVYSAGNAELLIKGNMIIKKDDGSWGVESLTDGALGFYSVSGLYAGSDYGVQKGSTIHVEGDVDLAIKGTGILANGGGATVIIDGGGNILTNKESKAGHYALIAQSGHIRMNMNADMTDAGKRPVKIYGDLATLGGSIHSDEPDKTTGIHLGLSTTDSFLYGIAENTVADPGEGKWTGEIDLVLKNGALWNHEVYSDCIKKEEIEKEKKGKIVESRVYLFKGAKTKETRGIIMQNSEKRKIRISNYSGHTLVLYKHDKTDPKKMIGGDFIINKAEKDSMITLRTDNEGMNALSGKKEERNKVSEILNALANKLYYTAYKDGETNLKGKVEIAEGLTAQSASYRLEDMTFKKENGQGQYLFTPATEDKPDTPKPGEDPKPPTPDKPEPPVIYGPKQTAMMRGAKSAMTTTMLSMRDNMTTMTQRLGDIHEGTEDGIWARTYGGKANYDKDQTKTKENFWGVQIGADKKQASGWHTGISFDYQDGNATYELGGKGDPKRYTLGIYGTKVKDNGEYIDVVAKAGRGQNDYTVYNDMGHKLKGDYKANAMGLSVEYGKRIEKDNMYFTPQIQLSYMKLQGTDYDAISDYAGGKKMHVEQDGMTSLVGRIGIAAGKRTDKTDLYLKANLLHEFKGTTASTFSAENEPTATVDQDFGDTWAELTLGVNHNIDKDKMIYADITKSFGGDYEMEWKANAGIRLRF